MYLIQLLLPVYDNRGITFPNAEFAKIRRELAERFGGATAYTRSPAEGTWQDDEGRVRHDDVVVIEVMAPSLDREWWSRYRQELAVRFRQEELVARATVIESL